MKRFFAFLLAAIMSLALIACEDPEQPPQNNGGEESLADYYMTFRSQRVELGAEADAVIAALGDTKSAPENMGNCAGVGSTIKYVYDNIEICVLENEQGRFIDQIKLMNDLVTDSKGLCIGSTIDELIEAYGSAVSAEDGQKSFSVQCDAPYTDKPATKNLIYKVKNGVISAIEYSIAVN